MVILLVHLQNTFCPKKKKANLTRLITVYITTIIIHDSGGNKELVLTDDYDRPQRNALSIRRVAPMKSPDEGSTMC